MNQYDDLQIDVRQLIEKQKQSLNQYNLKAFSQGNFLIDFFKILFDVFLGKTGIKKRLIYSNWSLKWFDEFQKYWVEELKGRPIKPHDFYYLFCQYRQKFQSVQIADSASSGEFLKVWQDSRNIYSVFAYVYKFALNPLSALRFAKYISCGDKVLEYGCGTAPIAQSLTQYYSHKKIKIHCADIPNLMIHYARWKMQNRNFVKFIYLDPENRTPLNENYNIIFLMTVLEHLPYPLAIVKHLYARLEPSGILIFDYIKSDGNGLDTKEGVKERLDVLKFIKEKFEILEGEILLDGSDIKLVVARKV